MDLQDSCSALPSTCFKLKSCVNSWLSVDSLRNTKFSIQQEESCVFLLLPRRDEHYMLQLLRTSLTKLHEHFGELCEQGCFQFDCLQEEAVQGCCTSTGGGPWYFRKQGQCMKISQYAPEFHEDFCFSLEFDDYGGVALASGMVNKGYWTLNSSGQFLCGAQNIGKRETFQLHEYGWLTETTQSSRTCMAPVRINLRAHTGQYLCGAATVISALAEAPCCCEEFLLDVHFPPLPPSWKSSESTAISGQESQQARQYSDSFQASYCKIRTANGMFNWSTGADGKLITVQIDEAQAHEHFTVSVLSHKRYSLVSIGHHSSQDNLDCVCYVSVEPSSRVTCNKLQRGKWEEFALELVNESRVLIQSVHGYFLGSQEASMLVNTSAPSICSEGNCTHAICPKSSIGIWRLRAHGDSRYTLLAATSPRDQGDVYLYVDGSGKLLQSNDPSIHFPSFSSLFEIKPVTQACFIRASEGPAQQSNTTSTIVGFTIKTIRKINGHQRYFSAEPNGVLRVNAVCVSRWEIFRVLDVDGTASAARPHEFSCVPAAAHLPSGRTPITSLGLLQDRETPGTRGTSWLLDRGSFRGLSENIYGSGKPIESIESLKRASQVAAMATRMGICLPTRMSASLQELCINELCLQASAEVTRLCDKFQESLAVAWVTDCLVESCFGIPDDLCTKIVTHWCSRQHPESSCKSLQSTFPSQRDYFSHSNRNAQGPSYGREDSLWESNDEGFYCHSCNQRDLLKMDPSVNPAHHRYLEVQFQTQNAAARSTGFLWNLISFAGVSIMSTVLLFHFFVDRNKKRRSSGSI